MIGHQQIIDWRQEGMKPAAIFVSFGHAPVVGCRFDEPEKAMEFGLYPTVYVQADERPDMRFCVGCSVHLHADRFSDELLDLADRITHCAPETLVVACTEEPEIMIWKGGWNASA